MNILTWVISVGIVGLLAGYYPPIMFTTSNIGPLLGIFLTGPDGLLLGLMLGYMCHNLSFSRRTQIYIWCINAFIILVGTTYIFYHNNAYRKDIIDYFMSFFLPHNFFIFLLCMISMVRSRFVFGCSFVLLLVLFSSYGVMRFFTRPVKLPMPMMVLTVTPLTISGPLTTVDITTLKFGAGQVFDAKSTPTVPYAGYMYSVFDFKNPLDSAQKPYSIGKGEYLQLFYLGDTCKDGAVGINLYNADGKLIRTVQPKGYIFGLSLHGFLFMYKGIGTFFSLQPIKLKRITYMASTGMETCAALQSYRVPPEALAGRRL